MQSQNRKSKILTDSTLLALVVLKEKARALPPDSQEDLIFLIYWFLFKSTTANTDEIWNMILKYTAHFTEGKEGRPDLIQLQDEVRKDPVKVLNRTRMSQEQLAAATGIIQEDISRFWQRKRPKIDRVRKMTVVIALQLGFGKTQG